MMSAQRYRSRMRRRALSLVEASVSMVLVGIVVIAALNTVGASKFSQAKVCDRQSGYLAAQELLNEIMLKDYADQTAGANSFGIEAGESTGNRRYFDDVDDYDGLAEEPPQEFDGTEIVTLKHWRQTVDVAWVALNDLQTPVLSNQGYKRIAVSVYHDGIPAAELIGVKSQGLPALEACCRRGACEELSATDCTANGGVTKGKGSHCWTTDCTIADILMVVTNPASLNSQETLRCDMLKALNFGVKFIDDAGTKAEYDTALSYVKVAFVSVEVDEAQLANKLAGAAIGVVFEDPDLGDDFNICNSYTSIDRSALRLVNTTHFITSVFGGTTLNIFNSVQPVSYYRSGLALGATQLGSWLESGSTYVGSLIVVEKGGLLNNLSLAPARRVRLPWGRAGFDFSRLNANGQTVLYRSVLWAASLDSEVQEGLGGLLKVILDPL